MTTNSREQAEDAPRWRYLLLAAFIFVLTAVLMAGLWQLPRLLPGTVLPGTMLPGAGSPTAEPPTALPATATPTPGVLQPTITDLAAEVDDAARTVTFRLSAEVPPERNIAEVLLWYDTEAGHSVERSTGPFSNRTAINYRLDAATEGLTRTLTTTRELDYWWLVRDTAGESVREGGSVTLGPNLWSSVTALAPEPPPLDFTWAVSESQHYQLHFVPDTAAERDRFQIGTMAEKSLADIQEVLDVDVAGQMRVYLVPRIFWQGGAAYGDKVQLIAYLDRNYTGVEIWSYFTHEGTHALAQDLLQPKEDGGPDGVLVEGLAVWASDGHYRQEPLDEWAAVVAASEDYLPLVDLRAGPFYDFQHETAYLEGASFVKFLVERYGLDSLKELYGRATGDAEHDEALVRELYGKGYEALEAEWLDYLASLDPSPEQAAMWHLKVRSFDLMRRYETELDPDARLLPSKAPPEWTSDTLKVFLSREDAPVNVVLETALIAVQERIHEGDLEGATALLDDVEAALNAGGELARPSLEARRAILDLLAAQDRAILRADDDSYARTLDPTSALAREAEVEATLRPPFTSYQQEVVRLDVSDDGLAAEGVVLVDASTAGEDFPQDGRLFAVTFVRAGDRWLMSGRQPTEPVLSLPPWMQDEELLTGSIAGMSLRVTRGNPYQYKSRVLR